MPRILENNEIFFTAFEPQVQNRFIFEIDGIPAYLIKKASAPSLDAGEVILDHINIYRKIKCASFPIHYCSKICVLKLIYTAI